MKEYLKNIHQKSPEHKKRFALVVSGGTTLIIFGIWSAVVFGGKTAVVADAPVQQKQTEANSPFSDIREGVANSLQAVKQQAEQIKETITSVNVENKYQEVRNQALSN